MAIFIILISRLILFLYLILISYIILISRRVKFRVSSHYCKKTQNCLASGQGPEYKDLDDNSSVLSIRLQLLQRERITMKHPELLNVPGFSD